MSRAGSHFASLYAGHCFMDHYEVPRRGYLEPLMPMVAGPSLSAARVPGMNGCAVGAPLAAPTAHPFNESADGTRRRPGGVLDVAGKTALFVVAGRREGILVAWLPEFAVLDLAAEFGALLLVHLGLADV